VYTIYNFQRSELKIFKYFSAFYTFYARTTFWSFHLNDSLTLTPESLSSTDSPCNPTGTVRNYGENHEPESERKSEEFLTEPSPRTA
jgi:hypothetical protein